MAGERYGITIADYNGEKTSLGLGVGVVTVGTLPGLLTQINTLRTAIEAVTLGVVLKDQLIAFDTPRGTGFASDKNAQVERKWKVVYTDAQQFFDAPTNAIPNEGYGKRFHFEIGTADATLLEDNEERLDITSGAGLTLKNAIEAMGRSPHGGTVQVQYVELVGRNR